MNDEFIKMLQRHIANISIGSSTVRNRPPGTVLNARMFLAKLDLTNIKNLKGDQFDHWLNKKTISMMKNLTDAGQEWGLSRKCLNIFLRNVLYNRYLYKEFKLRPIEPLLEVPLDSQVAEQLRNEPEGEGLPRWPWLKNLDERKSKLYQGVAAKVSKSKGLPCRVHLDVLYWRNNPKKN